jgi:hypothetical protein
MKLIKNGLSSGKGSAKRSLVGSRLQVILVLALLASEVPVWSELLDPFSNPVLDSDAFAAA